MADTNQVLQSNMEEGRGKIRFDGKRFLMAEDMEINAEILKQLLLVRGAEVEHAVDGRQAVKLFTESEAGYFDLILMDIRMPDMDGFEAARAIRTGSHPDRERIPIIAMTAYSFEKEMEMFRQAGMDEYLKKPLEPEKLFQTIDAFIKNGRTAREWTED